MYFQMMFAFDRIKATGGEHPEWKEKEPFKAVLDGDLQAFGATGQKGLLEVIASDARRHDRRGVSRDRPRVDAHRPASAISIGRTTSASISRCSSCWCTCEPRASRRLSSPAAASSSCGRGCRKAYGIPPEQVVGSSGVVKFEMRDGKPVLMKEAEGRIHRRWAGQTGRHQPLHRPAADHGVRQLRRRPTKCSSGRPRASRIGLPASG